MRISVVVLPLLFACSSAPPPPADGGDDEGERECVEGCDVDDDCVIGAHGGSCVDGECVSAPIDGGAVCVNDVDCELLVATFSGTKEFRCNRSSECTGPAYRGPCITGHSSGISFCGAPYFGICNFRLVARERNAGDVELCLAAHAICVDGQCRAPSEACASADCVCEDASQCNALFLGSEPSCLPVDR